jgi:LysW-gamma-L-lysine carboxypeptidase
MQDYPLQLLDRMLGTYSPSGQETEIANFLAEEFERIGCTVSVDEVGNVIGEAGAGSPSVMLCGHMDTVPGPIPVRTEGGNIYGRGAVDAKASLAAMIVASAEIIERAAHGRLLLVAVVDEERAGKGIRNIIKKGLSPDYAVFGEPSGVRNLIIGYKGSLRVKVTCQTVTGHSASPWLFDNAIEVAFKVWNEIARIHFPEEDLESLFYSTTSCLTAIEGGSEFGKVPSKCAFRADIRIPPQVTVEKFMARARDRVEQFCGQTRGAKVTIELEESEQPFEADKSSPLVRSFGWAIRRVTSQPAVLLRKTGTGDINAFSATAKQPMIAYGPGDSRLDHTDDEHIGVLEYLQGIRVFREALDRLLGSTP